MLSCETSIPETPGLTMLIVVTQQVLHIYQVTDIQCCKKV